MFPPISRLFLAGVLLTSCTDSPSVEDDYRAVIRDDLKKFDLALIQANAHYQATLAYEKKVAPAFHVDSLGWDSLTNVRLLKLEQELTSVISAHSESVYQLERIIADSKKRFLMPSDQKVNPKYLKAAWKDQKETINDWVHQEESANGAVSEWRKKLFHHYSPEGDTLAPKEKPKDKKNPKP